MQYFCDAPGRKTWFRIETEGEAILETQEMRHGIEYRFQQERQAAIQAYRPDDRLKPIERNIGLNSHVARTMPLFLTLREHDGTPLATAMLPRAAKDVDAYSTVIVGPDYSDPFAAEAEAIAALEKHLGVKLSAGCYNPFRSCFP